MAVLNVERVQVSGFSELRALESRIQQPEIDPGVGDIPIDRNRFLEVVKGQRIVLRDQRFGAEIIEEQNESVVIADLRLLVFTESRSEH